MSDTIKYPDIDVQITGQDGNAFAILGKVRNALPREVRSEFMTEATSGDFNHLLATAMRWVNIS